MGHPCEFTPIGEIVVLVRLFIALDPYLNSPKAIRCCFKYEKRLQKIFFDLQIYDVCHLTPTNKAHQVKLMCHTLVFEMSKDGEMLSASPLLLNSGICCIYCELLRMFQVQLSLIPRLLILKGSAPRPMSTLYPLCPTEACLERVTPTLLALHG